MRIEKKSYKQQLITNNQERLQLKLKILFLFVVVGYCAHSQQHPQYGQYMFNQFALNPAYAGSRNILQSSIHYRNQWDGYFPGAPKTFLLNINSPVAANKMALGFQMMSDRIGPKSSFGMLGTYAYRIRFYRSALSAGLRLGFFQYTFRFNEVEYKDAEPIWSGFSNYQRTVPAADVGFFYSTSDMYVGLSFNQLIGGDAFTYNDIRGNNLTLTQMRPHIFLTSGKAFKLKNGLILNPSVICKAVEDAPLNIDVNMNVLIDERLWFGALFRSGYGTGVVAQVVVNRNFKIGFARDRGMKILGGPPAARSNEFLIHYDFSLKNIKSTSPKYL